MWALGSLRFRTLCGTRRASAPSGKLTKPTGSLSPAGSPERDLGTSPSPKHASHLITLTCRFSSIAALALWSSLMSPPRSRFFFFFTICFGGTNERTEKNRRVLDCQLRNLRRSADRGFVYLVHVKRASKIEFAFELWEDGQPCVKNTPAAQPSSCSRDCAQ